MDVVEHVAQRYGGEPWLFEPSAALAVGGIYIIGADGDKDPGRVLHDLEVYNDDDADDIWVSTTLTGAVTAGSTNRTRVPAGKSVFLPGAIAQLVVFNPTGSGGTVVWGVRALNLGRVGPDTIGGHPGHGEYVARVTVVQNDTVTVEVTANRNITISSVKVYSNARNTSAAGTVSMAVENADGDDVLNTASYDLEAISDDTLTACTLTATTARLDIDAGETISVIVTSNNADMVEGDLQVAIGYSLR